ncbi:uncharacterized protein [Leptinotarsa decemlineata]|uniref:uncharacterized protein n=1 Tax=Leptinotarsa decemlineata TaxID=7539 RepID=UPI003D30B600
MGQLPASLLQPAPPFNTTGIDYAGPILVKDRKGRGSKLNKSYIGLFICFATKTIHLELISYLTKYSFLMAFRRFMARRGKPSHLFFDNSSNFVSARSHLKELGRFLSDHKNELENEMSEFNIKWDLIPLYSPHFGRTWEAGIKSSKAHLKRVVGNAHLTFEELNTVLVQVEAVLNSGPLFPISSDPEDVNPLTPAHFLVGIPLTTIPNPNFRDIPMNQTSRYLEPFGAVGRKSIYPNFNRELNENRHREN